MTRTEDLRRLIDSMPSHKILVIGDIMLDRYFYGKVSRISPEAPVPVLHVNNQGKMLGGAGNVMRNLDGLGVKSRLISIIGNDDNGKIVQNMVDSLENADHQGIKLIKTDRPTTVKSRYVAHGQQLLRADEEDKSEITANIQQEIVLAVKAQINDVNAVILSDYDKGLLTPGLIKEIITLANASNVKTLIDPKGNDYSIYSGAYVVTPNRDELAAATGNLPTHEDGDIIKAANQLIASSGIQNVIATRSEDGLSIIQSQSNGQEDAPRPVHLPTLAQEVYDVSGAGDTVIASIAATLASGGELLDAARIANIAGGIVVAKTGTAPVHAHEIIERIEEDGEASVNIAVTGNDQAPVMRASKARVMDIKNAKQQIEDWQRKGLRIGLTNGCFDLLHPGHVQYLHEARMLCDRLVVALNHDTSVKILKGPERPVQDQNARAAVIGALAAVDLVVFFGAEKAGDDNTASEVVSTLKPDIYVKGGDYKLEDIPEAGCALAYGGQARVLSIVEGHSTTNNINKIKKTAS